MTLYRIGTDGKLRELEERDGILVMKIQDVQQRQPADIPPSGPATGNP